MVLCLIGEGFAKTLAKEGLKSAMWRGSMTALVAVFIALLSRIHSLISLLLHFPELLVMQIGLVVLIAEFFWIWHRTTDYTCVIISTGMFRRSAGSSPCLIERALVGLIK